MSLPKLLEVIPGSPAEVAGLAPGDELVSINGVIPNDVIEYQQLADDTNPLFLLKRDGTNFEKVLVKPEGSPVGLRLGSSLFDRVQTCDNHCSFCFIYQLPPGMRKSLYLKDDDYRLSFLYGNFTTLTRFTELDLARVIEEGLGPLYVSIHATDPDVRAQMLRNPRGATSLRWLEALLDNGIKVHGQIVLCPGVNNGELLERTLAETLTRFAKLETLGIVPLGLSKFNTEPDLRVHTPKEAASDLSIIEFWQEQALRILGRRIFQASDELYITAGIDVPDAEHYNGYQQHENGIGMVRAFYDELDRLEHGSPATAPIVTGEWRSLPAAPAEGYRALRHRAGHPHTEEGGERGPLVVVTGTYGRAVLNPVRHRFEALTSRKVRILEVPNNFFGGNAAVAGLLVGEDIINTIKRDTEPAGVYVIPDVALSGNIFIDDTPLSQVIEQTDAPVVVAPATAAGLVGAGR